MKIMSPINEASSNAMWNLLGRSWNEK